MTDTALPTGWSLAEDPRDPTHPWRLEAERLAAGNEQAPHPAPVLLVRALCALVGGQRAASRLLQADERSVRRWCLGERAPSHAAVELLRLAAGGQWP